MKQIADYEHFEALDVRVGRILEVEDAQTRKPTYRLTIDFGPEVGIKRSCGAYRYYRPDQLVGQQILGVINFGPKQMGPEISEVLVLGFRGPRDLLAAGLGGPVGATRLLSPRLETRAPRRDSS
jgi:tRNA-binding protein